MHTTPRPRLGRGQGDGYDVAEVLLFGGCLINELEELVELRRDDDLGAAVAAAACLSVVAFKGIVFATSACGKAAGVDAVLFLQSLNYARSAEA